MSLLTSSLRRAFALSTLLGCATTESARPAASVPAPAARVMTSVRVREISCGPDRAPFTVTIQERNGDRFSLNGAEQNELGWLITDRLWADSQLNESEMRARAERSHFEIMDDRYQIIIGSRDQCVGVGASLLGGRCYRLRPVGPDEPFLCF